MSRNMDQFEAHAEAWAAIRDCIGELHAAAEADWAEYVWDCEDEYGRSLAKVPPTVGAVRRMKRVLRRTVVFTSVVASWRNAKILLACERDGFAEEIGSAERMAKAVIATAVGEGTVQQPEMPTNIAEACDLVVRRVVRVGKSMAALEEAAKGRELTDWALDAALDDADDFEATIADLRTRMTSWREGPEGSYAGGVLSAMDLMLDDLERRHGALRKKAKALRHKSLDAFVLKMVGGPATGEAACAGSCIRRRTAP